MARPLRIEFPGAVYHVTSRGDRREPIVLGDEDREDLLGVLGQALHRFDACALAWCLMDNHYHCWRRFKIEPPCRLNFEPGLMANL